MPLPKNFPEQLAEMTDAELYDMLAHQDDYLPEALAAAGEEFRKRNLPPERVARLEAVARNHQAAEDAKAGERLEWPMRILIFFLCAGIGGALLAVYYDSKGFKRKASDCWITMGVGIAAHILLGIVIFLTT